MIIIASVCLLLALLPAIMIAINLTLFQRLPIAHGRGPISILVPARNEEKNIAQAVNSVLASADIDFELIVLDDHSTDATVGIVNEIALTDPRVRLEHAPPLPAGWCGKQHACAELAKLAHHDLLLWMDADVTLQSEGLTRIVAYMNAYPIDLLSGFPREITSGWLDALLIPLIHFVLLGYLPLWQMRSSNDERFGAGCGQLFIARRSAYESAGGHAAIRDSRHDGVKLPRAFRRAGFKTDIFDATDIASCRMYHGAGETWRGLLKNADEGLATPIGIVLWTVLLAGGSVLPVLILLLSSQWFVGIAIIAILVARFACALRFRQSIVSAVLHPVGVLLLLAIQWQSIGLQLRGMKTEWKVRN